MGISEAIVISSLVAAGTATAVEANRDEPDTPELPDLPGRVKGRRKRERAASSRARVRQRDQARAAFGTSDTITTSPLGLPSDQPDGNGRKSSNLLGL